MQTANYALVTYIYVTIDILTLAEMSEYFAFIARFLNAHMQDFLNHMHYYFSACKQKLRMVIMM